MSGITSKRRVGLFTRSLRITTGLVLLAFVTCHLLNASFGIISVKAMEAARPYLTEIWEIKPIFLLLFLSLIAHFILGLIAIYNRPTLRTNMQDLVQIVTAVCIVPMMAVHTITIYFLQQAKLDPNYELTVQSMWVSAPATGLIQVGLITVVWIHGCAGLITWLRSKESARNMLFWIYPVVVAIPITALLGYAEAGRSALAKTAVSTASQTTYGNKKDSDNYASSNSYGQTKPANNVAEYNQDRGANQGQTYGQGNGYTSPPVDRPAAGYGQSLGYGQQAQNDYSSGYGASKDEPATLDLDFVNFVTSQVIWWSIALAALTFIARFIRLALKPSQNVTLTFGKKKLATSRSGLSLLDVLRQNDEPHASLCEGRGRCGTCVVRILSSDFPLPEPTDLELRTLHAKGFPEGTRLACQLAPAGGHIDVETVFPPDYTFHDEEPDTLIDASEVQV